MLETLPVKARCLAHFDSADKILSRQGKGQQVKAGVRPAAEKN